MNAFKDGLYNRAVYLPAQLLAGIVNREYQLIYADHVRSKLLADKIIRRVEEILIAIPNPLPVKFEDVVEATVLCGTVSKIVIRRPFNESYDICLVIRPGSGNVVTHWFNHKLDQHSTLDRNKFIQA